jgi:hypothetical protein
MSIEKFLEETVRKMKESGEYVESPIHEPDILTPRYTHHCEQCKFLGGHNEFDLYYCFQSAVPTLIARFSNAVPDYQSGWPSESEALKKAKWYADNKSLVVEIFQAEEVIEEKKLTKKSLNDFILWSTSRYNNYLGFGTKKDNVDLVYNALKNGFLIYNDKTTVTIFNIECSGGVGESWNGKSFSNWRLKGRTTKRQDYKYQVDCLKKTITGYNSKIQLKFV